MKRLLLALALALAMASTGTAATAVSCNAVTTAGACESANTAAYHKITMTLFAVNATTGAVDSTATSVSEAVIEFAECNSCPWIRFPRDAGLGLPTSEAPITNISGHGRSWRLPRKTYKVRWNMLTLGAGRVTGVVTYDTE